MHASVIELFLKNLTNSFNRQLVFVLNEANTVILGLDDNNIGNNKCKTNLTPWLR